MMTANCPCVTSVTANVTQCVIATCLALLLSRPKRSNENSFSHKSRSNKTIIWCHVGHTTIFRRRLSSAVGEGGGGGEVYGGILTSTGP